MKTGLFFLFFFMMGSLHAQKDTAIQALEDKLSKQTTIGDKLDLVRKIMEKASLYYPDLAQSYIDKGIFWAEESRDRNAMVRSRRIAASYYLSYSRMPNSIEKASQFAAEALKLSKGEGISYKEQTGANSTMAFVVGYQGKPAEAFSYSQEAVTIANESNNDSLKILSLVSFGDLQLYFNEKIKAFKSYIAAREIAERSKDEAINDLLFLVYTSLADFYTGIENYDKAIDYQYKLLAHYKEKKDDDKQLAFLYRIGNSYSGAKKYNTARSIFEEMGRLSDSLRNPMAKTQSNVGLLNAMLESDEKDKGIDFLKKHPDIVQVFQKANILYLLDYGYAKIYEILNQRDSASYYYAKSLRPIQAKGSLFQQLDFYTNYGHYLYTIGDYPKAIELLNIAKQQADSTKNPELILKVVKNLDSCYQKKGDYKQAFYYGSLKNKIKEDIDEKSKAKDVLMLEIDSENKRAERLAKEAEEATIRRHNWQYMGIIIIIITLFSLLTVLGVFNVPIRWVRALGFISFIFFFEFIVLLADTWIHHATHGEPWKVLGIKVILIALLLPLHHWLEHKAIHFITARRKKEAHAVA